MCDERWKTFQIPSIMSSAPFAVSAAVCISAARKLLVVISGISRVNNDCVSTSARMDSSPTGALNK